MRPVRPGAWFRGGGGALLIAALVAGCAARPPVTPLSAGAHDRAAPRFENDAFIARDGRRLPLATWLPVAADGTPAPVRTVVVALHGFNDRKAAFAGPAAVWQHDGIATLAYDQRGFGANSDRGEWPGSRLLVEDLDDAIAAARDRFPSARIVALGESMGGAVILTGLRGDAGAPPPNPDRIVLVAPAVWGRDTMKIYERAALWVAIRLIPEMTFTGGDFGVLPSDNIPMLRAFSRDPLTIKDTKVRAIHGLVDLMDTALQARPSRAPPMLVLWGAHDELIPREATLRLLSNLARTGHLRTAYYPHGWHMLLRDLEGEAVARDVEDWIDDPDAPFTTGIAMPPNGEIREGDSPPRPGGGRESRARP